MDSGCRSFSTKFPFSRWEPQVKNSPNPLMFRKLLCKNYEMILNMKVEFQNKSSVFWPIFSQGSENFVYSQINTHTHTHTGICLRSFYADVSTFKVHMKRYEIVYIAGFLTGLQLDLWYVFRWRHGKRHISIPDFNSQAEVSY